MFAKLFSYFGLPKARKWAAQDDQARLVEILEYISASDSNRKQEDYDFVEYFYTSTQRSEFDKEFRAIRRKFAIRGCKSGIIECERRIKGMDAKLPAHMQEWEEQEKSKNGRKNGKRDSDPAFVDVQDSRTFDDVRDGVLPRTE